MQQQNVLILDVCRNLIRYFYVKITMDNIYIVYYFIEKTDKQT